MQGPRDAPLELVQAVRHQVEIDRGTQPLLRTVAKRFPQFAEELRRGEDTEARVLPVHRRLLEPLGELVREAHMLLPARVDARLEARAAGVMIARTVARPIRTHGGR